MLLRFREITYAKNVGFPSGIFLSNAKQKKPIVFLLFRGTMKSAKRLTASSCSSQYKLNIHKVKPNLLEMFR